MIFYNNKKQKKSDKIFNIDDLRTSRMIVHNNANF